MSKQPGPRPARDINKHWQSLAERRRQYLLELYRTGRWRRYYSEDEMQAQIRDVTRTIEGWSVLSGVPPQATAFDAKKPLGEAAE